MRFGKKSFIISVIAFILCLNLGFLSVAYFSYRQCVKNNRDVVQLQYEGLAASFESAFVSVVKAGNEGHVGMLMESYVNRYADDGVLLAFKENGRVICSSFDPKTDLERENSVCDITVDGIRYTMISSLVCEKYQMYFAVDSSDVDSEFNSMLIVFTVSAALLCLLITFVLYFAMSRSSSVVEKTLSAMENIAEGEACEEGIGDIKGDLAVVAEGFDKMSEAINQRIDATNKNADEKQMIVDMLANQLSSPLAQIGRDAGEIINRGTEDEETVNNAKRIQKQANRLQNVAEKLLDIATAREKALRLTDVDVAALLRDTEWRLSKYAGAIGVSIETAASAMSVKADEELLSLLVYNLTENAIKACHSGCCVVLSCEDGVITVKDNGSGMSEKQLEMITMPFYKGENEGYKSYGAGLGLTLCKQIIEVHGAKISFESAQGYGTTVRVDFNKEK